MAANLSLISCLLGQSVAENVTFGDCGMTRDTGNVNMIMLIFNKIKTKISAMINYLQSPETNTVHYAYEQRLH